MPKQGRIARSLLLLAAFGYIAAASIGLTMWTHWSYENYQLYSQSIYMWAFLALLVSGGACLANQKIGLMGISATLMVAASPAILDVFWTDRVQAMQASATILAIVLPASTITFILGQALLPAKEKVARQLSSYEDMLITAVVIRAVEVWNKQKDVHASNIRNINDRIA